MSTRPALSITDCRCSSTACSSSASTSAASADPPADDDVLGDRLDRRPAAPGEEDRRPPRPRRRVRRRRRSRLRLRRSPQPCPSASSSAFLSRWLVVGAVHRRCRHRGRRETGRRPTAQFAPRPVSVQDGSANEGTEREVTAVTGRPDRAGAGRGRRRVPRADRAVPARAAGALLPDARVLPGRRGRPAGHAAGRLAGPRRVRGARLAPHLALPDRHQPLPQRASLGQPATGQGVGHPRTSNRPSRPGSARSSGSSRIPTPSSRVRSTCRSARRPATSRPSPSRWPS